MREWMMQMHKQAGIATGLLRRTVRGAFTSLLLTCQGGASLLWSIGLVLLTLALFLIIPLAAFTRVAARGAMEDRA